MNSNNQYPIKSSDDISYSVDVIALDEDNLMHILFYNYKFNKWVPHDPRYTEKDLGNFIWIYKPVGLNHNNQLSLFE